MNISSDDRRLAFFNLFDVTPGQVNIVRLYPGSICAWHRHQKQTDYYFCVAGVVKVGMVDTSIPTSPLVSAWETLDAHLPRILTVPPGIWHGYTAIGDEAVLLQYLDRKFDPSDEERCSVQGMGISWDVAPR
jgi:dTDP-4-dehydrorhamnose 3,5-epimerase